MGMDICVRIEFTKLLKENSYLRFLLFVDQKKGKL